MTYHFTSTATADGEFPTSVEVKDSDRPRELSHEEMVRIARMHPIGRYPDAPMYAADGEIR